jgi:hypothetical protein
MGMPLSRAFDVGGVMGRTEPASTGPSSIADGVAPGKPGGTESLPRVLAWPKPADTGEPP